jgi:hypothetical protein
LYCVTQLIEKRLEVLQETYLVFVDLKKAYDSIPISKLWEALENTGISAQISCKKFIDWISFKDKNSK